MSKPQISLALQIERVRARVQRWKHEQPSNRHMAGSIAFNLGRAEDSLRKLLRQQRQENMRRIEDDAVTNSPEHPWRVTKGPLRFGDKVYHRGAVVPDEIVDAALNVARLIEGGHIRRLPAPKSTPIPAAVKKLAENPHTVKPRDIVAEAKAAIQKVSRERGITPERAIDLVPGDLVPRAVSFIAARDGKFGQRPCEAAYRELCGE
jgi:hypothetical protein